MNSLFTIASPLPPGYRWGNQHDPARITTCRQADVAADQQIQGLLDEINALRRMLDQKETP